MSEWWQGRLTAFDLETTAPLPEEARIVSAAVAVCGGGEPTAARAWLADPGVEIPKEATEVHGISTERARDEGVPVQQALIEVIEVLANRPAGSPLVVFNARYDFTVLDRECRRHGLPALRVLLGAYRAIDPSVIDKFLDRYRKSYPGKLTAEEAKERGIVSSRTLEGMCVVYGAMLDGAHDATFDAVAAARIAFRMGQRGEVKRRVRNQHEGRELAALKREWEDVRGDLSRLHSAQVTWALAERERFAEYKRSNGELEDADRIEAERGWPVLDIMEHEEAWAG